MGHFAGWLGYLMGRRHREAWRVTPYVYFGLFGRKEIEECISSDPLCVFRVYMHEIFLSLVDCVDWLGSTTTTIIFS